MSKYNELLEIAREIWSASQDCNADLNNINLLGLGALISEIDREKAVESHGSWIVCYVLDDEEHGTDEWEAFDCEADAVKRYEELVSEGDCYTVTIARSIRSTDYDCEDA